MLSALLGDMKRTRGVANMYGRVAYVAQQAWIQNNTLADNITFGKRFNNELYQKVRRLRRRKIRLIEDNTKCLHLKKLTYKGTLQVFIRLEIANFLCTFSHVVIFNPTLGSVLSPCLWFNSPPLPLPCVSKYTEYAYTVWAYEVLGLRQINTCHKVPLQVNFLDDDICFGVYIVS